MDWVDGHSRTAVIALCVFILVDALSTLHILSHGGTEANPLMAWILDRSWVGFLAVKTGLFPAIAKIDDDMTLFDKLNRTFLPALTMVLVVVAHMMRMTRASIINLLASPYVEMARLKGVPAWKVIVKHTLPNAWAPVINVVALNLAYLITGVVLVEVVFVYPGIGQLLVDAVTKRDFPVVQACCLIFAATFILLNLAADVGSILTNPRLRHPK